MSTGQGILGNNMFAYCNDNPVMYSDPSGQIGILGLIIGGGILLVGIIAIPSSEQQEPTVSEHTEAKAVADRADLEVRVDANGDQTIDIHIDTEDVLDNVEGIAMPEYYDCLYERMLEKAYNENIPTDNLMTRSHIQWEFFAHKIGFMFGADSAVITDLNVEETFWSMVARLIGW